MLIDWFTVIAQLLNFLILVWLLKRFLFQPILKAMDEREKHLTGQLQQAEALKAEAQEEKGHYQQMASELEQQRKALLQEVKQEADTERRQLMESAREDHRLLRARLRQALESERANLSRHIIRRLQEEVFEIARQVLAGLADSTLERQMAAVFARRLEQLSAEERRKIEAALQASSQGVTVRSTFALPPEQQQAIEAAARQLLPPGRPVCFEAAPALGPDKQADGIELFTEGYKMAWSITDYLRSLEKRIATILEEELEPETLSKTEDHGA